VPAEAGPLFTFLAERRYTGFAAEPSPHDSAGPHGQVRTFFDPLLVQSFEAGNTTHPVGAAAVKELHDDGALAGWAVMVKVGSGTGVDSWYWYEVFSTTDGSDPAAVSTGLPGCAGCHSSGVDHVTTPFPLQ
jgi:hypothetical protein